MRRKCFIIHQLHHLIYPVTDSMLHGNTSDTAVAQIEFFLFFKEEVKNRGAPVFGHPHMLVRTLFTYSQIFQQQSKARVPSRTVKAWKSFSPHLVWSVIVFHFFISCFYFVFSLCFQFSLNQSPAWVGLLSFAIVL